MDDVRGANAGAAEILQRSLVSAHECIEPVDRRAPAAQRTEAGAFHLSQRDFLNGTACRALDDLKQHHRLLPGFLRDDLRLTVRHVPSGREFDREPQVRMQKRGAAHDALIRVVAVDDAVNPVQIPVVIGPEPFSALLRFTHGRLHALHAILRRRMRLQPVRHALVVARLFDPAERRQHLRNAVGIPAGARHVLHAEAVGLRFVVAAVLQHQQTETALAELRERTRRRHEDAAENEPELRAGRSRVLLRCMTRRDVSDLVAEHAGQLRLVLQERQDAARYIDVAAGQGERVDGGDVDDGEVPRQVRTLGELREAKADVADVLLKRAVAVDAHLLADLGVLRLADLDFLVLAHQRELTLARGGIGRAGDRQHDERDGQTCSAALQGCPRRERDGLVWQTRSPEPRAIRR